MRCVFDHWPILVLVFVLCAIAGLFFMRGLARIKQPDPLEDEGQFRTLAEQGFVQWLDKRAKIVGHRAAWEEAQRAAAREPATTRNITRWKLSELLRATREFKQKARGG